jgi:hypothetical protein
VVWESTQGIAQFMPSTAPSEDCSILSTPCRHCRRRRSYCASSKTSLAISGLPWPPIMRGRRGCRTGSPDRVLAAYASIASRYAGILAGKDASILSSVFRSRGTYLFYQIRVGTDTFESADDLCVDTRRAGDACMVLRNGSHTKGHCACADGDDGGVTGAGLRAGAVAGRGGADESL